MGYPIKICVVCGEEFELRPDKPGFANRCPSCSAPEAKEEHPSQGDYRSTNPELNQERRKTMREMLYRKDS